MTRELHLVSAGAAKGLAEGIEVDWRERNQAVLHGTFGAVGAMREALSSGAPCDVIVLTAAMLDALVREGVVESSSVRPLGRVYTGIAAPVDAIVPEVGSAAALADALRHASAIYFPDPERATAGIHFAKVLRALDLHDALATRLRPFPNGATAMRAMADAGDARALGCTQVTEILYTPGVRFVAKLPTEFELSTVYCVGLTRKARDPALARDLIERLAGADTGALRTAGGFEPLA